MPSFQLTTPVVMTQSQMASRDAVATSRYRVSLARSATSVEL
jgi:hypothetical protein